MNPELRKIHEEALEASRAFIRAEGRLIEALIAVESHRVFVGLGYSSLFQYTTSELKLSSAVAYNAITVARKARQVPALQAEIRSGTIGISTAKKIVSVLTPENHAHWLAKAKSLPCRQLEKAVARENPAAPTPEKAKYVTGDRLSLALGVSEELMLKLRRAQDQVSRSRGKCVSLEETLEEMANLFLKRTDPLERARRVTARKGNLSASVKTRFTVTRTPIPAAVEHAVRLRDQGRCQFPKEGRGGICGSLRFVDLHHIRPVREGGPHTPENLQILCKTHHREVHRE